MGACTVCGEAANLRCASCKDQFYCNVSHQRDDWPRHKVSCRPWRIEETKQLGRHLIATRDLVAGDLIISEVPIVWGPSTHSEKRVCVGCGDVAAARCPGCAWYACKLACDGLKDENRHAIECRVLAKARIIPRCDLLLPLRMILLHKRGSSRWKSLMALQSHEEQRGPGTEAHEETEDVAEQLKSILQAFSTPREILTKICGLIDVNALETNPPEGCVAIYETACLLEHCCLANTRHSFSLDTKWKPRITVRASTAIKKGDHLSTTYTHVLWATRARREHLLATKYFACQCQRCKDPKELDSNLGTLRCPCGPGLILPKDPLDVDTEWFCSSCSGVLTSLEVLALTDRLGEEVDNAMSLAKVGSLRDLLSRLSVLLHPNHQHCVAVSHSLMQLLAPDDPQKLELCKRIVDTTAILDPHATRLALYTAVALRELSSCPGEDKRLHLLRATELLQHEPAKSPGEELRRLIEAELS